MFCALVRRMNFNGVDVKPFQSELQIFMRGCLELCRGLQARRPGQRSPVPGVLEEMDQSETSTEDS